MKIEDIENMDNKTLIREEKRQYSYYLEKEKAKQRRPDIPYMYYNEELIKRGLK